MTSRVSRVRSSVKVTSSAVVPKIISLSKSESFQLLNFSTCPAENSASIYALCCVNLVNFDAYWQVNVQSVEFGNFFQRRNFLVTHQLSLQSGEWDFGVEIIFGSITPTSTVKTSVIIHFLNVPLKFRTNSDVVRWWLGRPRFVCVM